VPVLLGSCYHLSRIMTYHVRHLPHWQPRERSIFPTWRLYGSLPQEVVERLRRRLDSSPERYFVGVDRVLDRAKTGACWLTDSRIAECVLASIQWGERILGHYSLRSFVIMSNHVHLLLDPHISIQRITKGLKGSTAREANRLLGRTGQPFWQDESFDHWVRNGKQFDRIQTYIENNPVAAGLAKRPQEWPWSSAAKK
jgi:putative transposase